MDDDNNTPETPPEPHHETPPPPETPAPDAHPHDDLRAIVTGLQEKVTHLETTVQGLLPENRDESPVKRPWTHRKLL